MSRTKISNPTSRQVFRIIDLLDNLSGGKRLTKKQLSDLYLKNVRTIERDIEDINLFKPGMVILDDYGRVAMGPGFTMPQPTLNNAQRALLIQLFYIARNLGVKACKDFENLHNALTADKPGEPSVEIVPVMPKHTAALPESELLEPLLDAIEYYNVVDLTYERNGDTFPVKHLKPLGFLIHDGHFYLQTLKGAKDEHRQYRLDRIKSCEATGKKFRPVPGAAEMLRNSRSIWGAVPPEERDKPVKLKITGYAREYFSTRELVPGQKITEQKNGDLVMTARLAHHMEVIPEILRWLPDVQVLAPEDLRKTIRSKAKAFLKL